MKRVGVGLMFCDCILVKIFLVSRRCLRESSMSLPLTWSVSKSLCFQGPDGTWGGKVKFCMQFSGDALSTGSVVTVYGSVLAKGQSKPARRPPAKRGRGGARQRTRVTTAVRPLSQRKRPLLPSPSRQTGVSVSMGSVKRSRDCEDGDNGGVAKRVKVSEVERMEEDIRRKFELCEGTTVQDLDILIAGQQEKVRLAELQFYQHQLQKSEWSSGGEECFDVGVSMDASVQQPECVDTEWDRLLEGCVNVDSMEVDFDWSGAMVVSGPSAVSPLLCLSPEPSFFGSGFLPVVLDRN